MSVRIIVKSIKDIVRRDTSVGQPMSPLASLGTPVQLINQFGGLNGFSHAVHELQSALYGEIA